MKLIIQIPCYNEARSLPQTLREIPRQLAGIDQVEILVVDDGSQDGSAAVAKEAGADHVICLPSHTRLAAAFTAGLDACLHLGADIILNTDADNQYDPQEIPALLQPVLDGRADGHRRQAGGNTGRILAGKKAAAISGERGGLTGRRISHPGRGQRLPGAQPGSCSKNRGAQRLYLNARDANPGGGAPGSSRAWAGSHPPIRPSFPTDTQSG